MAAVLQDTLIRCIAEEDDESNPAVIESQIKELESMTFASYPRTSSYLPDLRERVNEAIGNACK